MAMLLQLRHAVVERSSDVILSLASISSRAREFVPDAARGGMLLIFHSLRWRMPFPRAAFGDRCSNDHIVS